jgi:hypothetical protein
MCDEPDEILSVTQDLRLEGAAQDRIGDDQHEDHWYPSGNQDAENQVKAAETPAWAVSHFF